MKTLDDVYAYWFETPNDLKKWFYDGEQYDAQIRTDFESLYEKVISADCAAVVETLSTKHVLCTIILLDQFGRHMYRGSSKAFSADSIALQYALTLLRRGKVDALNSFEQLFALMPLQHSESIEHKDILLEFIQNKLETCSEPDMTVYKSMLLHTRGHRHVLTLFGRYPTRNTALRRASTPAEELYLTEGGVPK